MYKIHTLGWIGLGYMGALMPTNLLESENNINVYNHTQEKTAALVAAGAVNLNSPKELVEKSDI